MNVLIVVILFLVIVNGRVKKLIFLIKLIMLSVVFYMEVWLVLSGMSGFFLDMVKMFVYDVLLKFLLKEGCFWMFVDILIVMLLLKFFIFDVEIWKEI